ncbi:macro domain-like protein [Rickenella mellea]|uniref:Macro domain-like protein n=1 Tax=Rickenella mellea TaxID=50990 RepID=A0A4Y7QD28_9AGAM|nr:macro domain-like protein [Rickenella mellea]
MSDSLSIDFLLIVPQRENELYNTWKTALNSKLPSALANRFSFLRCKLNDLLPDTRFDAIVSPANSYGRLDGGFDAGIAFLLSPAEPTHLTQHIQTHIFQTHRGFVAPGTTVLVPLPSDLAEAQSRGTGCTHILLCPTMHWPNDVRWNKDVVYNTTWGILTEIDRHNRTCQPSERISRVLMPALGTGTGRIPPRRFTEQFALAVRNFDESLRKPEKWSAMRAEDAQRVWRELVLTWEGEDIVTQ